MLLGKGFTLTSPQPHEETYQSFVSVQKTCLQGVERESTVTERKRRRRREGERDKDRIIEVRKRRGEKGIEQRIRLLRCFLQFLYIPAASWGITLSISPNAKANTPTHLTHAFTALISHSIAHRLTEALRVDWLAVRSDTSHVPAMTAWATVTSPGIPKNRIMWLGGIS